MEGVGARLGRSSTRYGPTTVFSGPVRKWKKRWIHVSSPNNGNNSSHAAANGNGAANGNNSHLLLYKWTPLSSSSQANAGKGSAAASAEASPEGPRKRKFRYVPVSAIEEQRQEDAAKADDETKPKEVDPSSQGGRSDDKPDVNDVPLEEAQAPYKTQDADEDANEANLDLSLGLKSHDGERRPK